MEIRTILLFLKVRKFKTHNSRIIEILKKDVGGMSYQEFLRKGVPSESPPSVKIQYQDTQETELAHRERINDETEYSLIWKNIGYYFAFFIGLFIALALFTPEAKSITWVARITLATFITISVLWIDAIFIASMLSDCDSEKSSDIPSDAGIAILFGFLILLTIHMFLLLLVTALVI